jgi:cobalt-zinc-cadmium efflux system membrane fusion protein
MNEVPHSKQPSRRVVVGAAIAATGLAAIAILALRSGHSRHGADSPTLKADSNGVTLAPGAPQWHFIEIADAALKPPIAPLPAPGRVTFDELRTSAVGAPLAGRIESLEVRPGDHVEKGTKLFSMRSGAFADLERDMEAARATAVTKHRIADRVRELVHLEAAAQKEQLASEAEAREADLAVSATTAKLSSLKVIAKGQNLFWVLSPRKGSVVELSASPNQEVTPDREMPVIRISDLDEVLVLADVQESDINDIRRGTPAVVHTSSGASRAGQVEQVAEVVDPARRTVAVRVRVPNQDRVFRPNAMAEITFQTDSGDKRVRLPGDAVVTDGPRRVVFLAKGPGRLERVQVATGRERDGEIEILRGVEPGQRFVAKGALLLLNQIDLAD